MPLPLSSPPPADSSLVYEPVSYFQPLDLAKMFVRPQPLQVELGSGDGSFLVQYARAHPASNFIGVERLLGRLRKIDKKGRRAGLTNLRALRIEAGYFLQYLLPPQSTTVLHVYFPDPWPKRKHRKNRLVNEQFPFVAGRILVPNGTIYLRTDDQDYFEQMVSVFSAAPAFATADIPLELSSVVTDFERNFQARGVATLAAAYRLISI